jgi:mono/diheme cytochrome c family protein
MKTRARIFISILLTFIVTLRIAQGQDAGKRERSSVLSSVPTAVHTRPNPFEGKPEAVLAGRKLFERHCATCHGPDGEGRGRVPALNSDVVERATPGDLFWFVTNGNLWTGMPSWSGLPEARRWQIVAYVRSLRKKGTN